MWIFGKSKEHKAWERAQEERYRQMQEEHRLKFGPSECHEFHKHKAHWTHGRYCEDVWCRGLTGPKERHS